jgi:hypothetical protein
VVEGVDDSWIFSELSNLLHRSGRKSLPFEILITPAGGASEVTYIGTFMVGQNLDVVVLYDTDVSENTAKDKFGKNWLTRYKERKATALSLGPAVGINDREFSIEDLFPEEFYIPFVQSVYEKQLAAVGAQVTNLPNGEQLVKRVETFFDKVGFKFNKGSSL